MSAIEIKQTECLTEEEWRKLFGWGEDIFSANDLHLNWRAKDWHFLLYEDGEPKSHVGVLRHTISVDENLPVTVGGVGGVVTVPEAQGKGYAQMLMREVARFFENDWRVEAGLLFCLPRMVAFYQLLGWRKIEEPPLIEQPERGVIKAPMGIMVLPFGDHKFVWENAKVELESLPW